MNIFENIEKVKKFELSSVVMNLGPEITLLKV